AADGPPAGGRPQSGVTGSGADGLLESTKVRRADHREKGSPVKRAAQGLGEPRYVMYLPTAESEGTSTRGATSAVARRRQLGVSMKSLPQWSATALLAAPVGAWALGLGDIELQSALNQPLRAEIELLSVTPEDLDGLRVGLASRATFERFDLDLTPDLAALQ